MMKLTDESIQKITADSTKSTDYRWDRDCPGFGVRVYASGRKSYVVSYQSNGKKRIKSLGSCDVIELDTARKKAQRLKPDTIHATKINSIPMAELCQNYLERYAKIKKKSWKNDESRIHRHIAPHLGKKNASEITHNDVLFLHTEIGKTAPYQANRVVALISKIYNLAQKWEIVNNYNPARDIDFYREHKRARYITKNEMPRLLQAINCEQNIYAGFAMWMYLLTGARKEEILSLRWADIDYCLNEMVLEDTKNGKTHYVPLSSAALSLLARIPRLEGNEYIFPGKLPGKHLINISKAWNRIKKAADVEDVRIHDLRRTVGSWLAQDGRSLHLIGQVLNHSCASTTQIYARFGRSDVRDALEVHGQKIVEMSLPGSTKSPSK
jgi:integrase